MVFEYSHFYRIYCLIDGFKHQLQIAQNRFQFCVYDNNVFRPLLANARLVFGQLEKRHPALNSEY